MILALLGFALRIGVDAMRSPHAAQPLGQEVQFRLNPVSLAQDPHERLESLPRRVHGVGAEHVLGSTWHATRDLALVSWNGGDRLGLCQYVPRVELPTSGFTPELRAGTRLRLVATYDADEAAKAAGVHDVIEFYEYCASADHLTFEVLDGPRAGQTVQARLDPITEWNATAAAAALMPEPARFDPT